VTCDYRDCPAPATEIRPPDDKYSSHPLCYCRKHAAIHDKNNEARRERDQPIDTGSLDYLLRASIEQYQTTGELP